MHKGISLTLAAALLCSLGGCAAYNRAMGTDLESPWWQCTKVDGGPSKGAVIAGGTGTILAGPAIGGLATIAADPMYSQHVQDCRRKILEEQGKQ